MSWSILNRLFSTFFFYFAWVLCLNEAAKGKPTLGIILITLFVIYYLYTSAYRLADAILLSVVVLIGPISDVVYTKLGVLSYKSQYHLLPYLPPLWVFALWALFGVNIYLFSWLGRHFYLAMALGAIGGPLSYLSVVKLGGASLLTSLPIMLITIGVVWSIFFPCSIMLSAYLRKRFRN